MGIGIKGFGGSGGGDGPQLKGFAALPPAAVAAANIFGGSGGITPLPENVLFNIDVSDSDSITLSGSAITNISDQSDAGRDFVGDSLALAASGGSATNPTLVSASQNGLDTASFDSSRSLFKGTGSSITVRHIFAVAKYNSATFIVHPGLVTTANGVNVIGLTGNNGDKTWLTNLDISTYYENLTNQSGGEPSAINVWTVHSISGSSGITDSTFLIGHDRGYSTRGWGGEIAQVICYDIVLGSTDRDDLITALMTKWGIV